MGSEVYPVGWERPQWAEKRPLPFRVLAAFRRGLVQGFFSDLENPVRAQAEALGRVRDSWQGTTFSRDHGLEHVRTVAEFRRAVPIRRFAELSPWFERTWSQAGASLTRHPLQGFVQSSGTTGTPKRLPVTGPWAAEVADAQFLWLLGMLHEQPELGNGFVLASVGKYPDSFSPMGLPNGANTGRMARQQPLLVKSRYVVPSEVWSIADPDVRTYVALRLALARDIRTWTTANPSTILAWRRSMDRWREELSADLVDGTLTHGPAASLEPYLRRKLWGWTFRRSLPKDFHPLGFWKLGAVNCWKGGFAPYFLDRLPEALGGVCRVREVGITASEGYFAVPLHSSWTGGVAWTRGHFLEFIPEEGGDALGVEEVTTGGRYRLVISTTAGLYRYDMEDVVEVVGWMGRTPLLTFVGKTRDTLSVVGEKVTTAQLSMILRQFPSVQGFSVGPILANRPWYELWVEGEVDPLRFDQALQTVNAEYADRRATDRMGVPTVRVLPPGTWADWRRARLAAGVAEGQLKEPIIRRGDGSDPGFSRS